MAANAYLKDWEPASALTKLQGELLGELQRVVDTAMLATESEHRERLQKPSVGHKRKLKDPQERPAEGLEKHGPFVQKVERREKEIEEMLNDVQQCVVHVGELKKHHEELLARTNDFQSKCGSILREQKTLNDISEEIARSLEHYKSIDAILHNLHKRPPAALLADEAFPHTLTQLDDAEVFFAKNPDYLDSGEYVTKIEEAKKTLTEIVEGYVQGVVGERYAQSWSNTEITHDNLQTIRDSIYASIDGLESVKANLRTMQDFAVSHSTILYIDTFANTAAEVFAARKPVVTLLCDYLVTEAMRSNSLSTTLQRLLQLQLTLRQGEHTFFTRYFTSVEQVAKDIADHFEFMLYGYIRPLIIQESNVAELSAAIVLINKVFFDPAHLFGNEERLDLLLDKKFLLKAHIHFHSLDQARHAGTASVSAGWPYCRSL